MLDAAQMAALFVALVGGAFKIMHWPGANVMLITGLGSLACYHFFAAFTAEKSNRNKVMLFYARHFSIAVLVIGILFKLMHWPNGQMMLYVGVVGVAITTALQMTGQE